MKIELDCQTILAVVLIIVCGIFMIYLPHLEKRNQYIEHFPSTMRYSDNIRKEPKAIIPKIITTMHNDAKNDAKNYNTLPDDYMYLYDYEKNFDSNKVYGDFSSRLDAYQNFLMRNRNDFHNLSAQDIDNLTKLLNGRSVNERDISNNFSYEQEYKAVNQ